MAEPEDKPVRSLWSGGALAGLVLGAVCLWFALKGSSWGEVDAALSAVRWSVLLPVAIIFLLQQALRAWRQWLLVRPTCPETTYWNQLSVLCISFFCINCLPARSGELVRPWLLFKKEGLPLGAGFAVVVMERLLDLASTLGLLGIALAFGTLHGGPQEIWGRSVDLGALLQVIGLGVVLPGILALGVLVWAGPGRMLQWLRLLERLPGGSMWSGLAESFVQAVGALRSAGHLGQLVAATVVTWLGTGGMLLLLSNACGLSDWVGYADALGILALTMLATALPSPPGFVGVYEAGVLASLALFGVPADVLTGPGLVFALVLHWWTFGVQTSSAIFFFVSGRVEWSYVRDGLRRSRSA